MLVLVLAVPTALALPGVLALPPVARALAPVMARLSGRRSSVIVSVARAADMDTVRRAIEARGGFVKKRFGWNAYLVSAPPGVGSPTFSRTLERVPGVRYAEGNATVHIAGTANDPDFPNQWGTSAIGAPTAWDSSEGSGVAIAVLDTGIDSTHEDLTGASIVGYRNYIHSGSSTIDDSGHGTHVAGIIAAVRDNHLDVAGAAPRAKLYAGKVLDSTGTGDISTVATAIRDIADNTTCRIINLSLEDSTGESSQALGDAVAHAQSKGLLLVASAGNDGTTGTYYPASLPGVIGVSAVGQNLARASFSNFGTNLVDLAAPGVDILSTVLGNKVQSWSGTSMAAPFVSASAALVWSAHPNLGPSAIAGILEKSAQDLGAPGLDAYYGHGLVRADLALATAPDILNPVTTAAPSPAVPDGSAGWYRTAPAILLVVNEAASTSFHWDSGPWTAYDVPLAAPEGSHVLWYRSADKDGNIEQARSLDVNVDTQAPTSSMSGLPQGGIAPGGMDLSISASDAVSGIGATYYTLDGGPSVQGTGPIPVASGGSHRVSYWSTDKAGNAETPRTVAFRIFDGLPMTSLYGIPEGWSRQPVTLSLEPTGDASPFVTRWGLSGSADTTYSAPFTLTEQGETVLTFSSEDSKGRLEPLQSAVVHIDDSPPVTTLSGLSEGNVRIAQASFSLSATDTASGVAGTWYRLDGGPDRRFESPMTVGAGFHTLMYWSDDVAGNAEPRRTLTFTVQPPPAPGTITVGASPSRVRLGRAFVLSGVLKPGSKGKRCVVEVRKPRSARWSYSSARLTYDSRGAWWYRYVPKLRGAYTFRVRYLGGSAVLPCVSRTITVRVL